VTGTIIIIIQEKNFKDVENEKLKVDFYEICQNRYSESEIGIPCTEPSAKYHGVRYFGISLHLYIIAREALKGCKIYRPMLGAQGLWAWRDLYRPTPIVTQDLGFSSLIRRIAPFSCLL
jgi:hypothetical protein